jgi:hypothetical protein
MLAASTCDELRACSRPTSAQLSVCDTTDVDTCVGNVLINCSMKKGMHEVTADDCAKAGLVCGASADGGQCGLAACDPATTQPRCDGNLLVTCEDQGNVLRSLDCARDGRSCQSNSAGLAICAGSTACDAATSQFHCDGTTMVRCHQGSEMRTDCAMLGSDWTCLAEVTKTENSGAQYIRCVPVAQECILGENESCADGVITYCDAGHVAKLDCRSLGLSGCSTKATSTTTVAGCVQ